MKWVIGVLIVISLFVSACIDTNPDPNPDDYIDYQDSLNRTNSTNSTYNDTEVRGYYDIQYAFGSLFLNDFGISKANNPDLMNALRSIVVNYDVFVLQGVSQDISNQLNEIPMKSFITNDLGNERYVFLFSHKVEPGKLFYYPGDGFARKPVVMDFKTEREHLVVINAHLNPYNAEQEFRNLPEVVSWAEKNFGTDNIFIMGNLYSDCLFFDSFHLTKDYGWRWVIDEHSTTVQDRDCAYDRIITTKGNLQGPGEVDGLHHIRKDVLRGVTHHYAVRFNYFERVYYG